MTTSIDIDISAYRQPEHDIEQLFVNRWSPRAMSGEVLSDTQLMALFEAARWAPSSYNNQPWRFLYAKRDTVHWTPFFDLLIEGNQRWAKNAAVLVLIASTTRMESDGSASRTYAFDCGAAWQNLALQATAQGLVAHGMQGFDYDKARDVLQIPDDHSVLAMVALGKPGRLEDLHERLRSREQPSGRKNLSELVLEGGFPK
ncbi:MAG: nitroreductase family protein [bacterium]|nr:nitroreductase family protein [bacterium]